VGPAHSVVFQVFVNELLDVHDDADECHLLLFDSLSDQIILEKVRVVDVTAHVAALSLLPPQTFLALARTSRE